MKSVESPIKIAKSATKSELKGKGKGKKSSKPVKEKKAPKVKNADTSVEKVSPAKKKAEKKPVVKAPVIGLRSRSKVSKEELAQSLMLNVKTHRKPTKKDA